MSLVYAQRSYVIYPPEGPRPPTAEELRELSAARHKVAAAAAQKE